ncbi:MAG: hypothetical protein HYS41_06240 [Candidatus Omnitrophica bacterium]|nr:hypothetical protein [Candidatus Omnitrophota bacterium]
MSLFGASLFLLAVVLAAGGAAVWVQSPAGEAGVSRWLTARVQKEYPGTRLAVSAIRWAAPEAVRAGSVAWLEEGSGAILELKDVRLTIGLTRKRAISWNLRGRVQGLHLASADRLFSEGRWQATGVLSGWVELSGGGGKMEVVGLKLEAGEDGGNLNNEVLSNLLSMLPAGAAGQEKILKALRAKTGFHYAVCRLEVAVSSDDYRMNLLLDGDHLLDLTVSVPKEGLGDLAGLFLKEVQ